MHEISAEEQQQIAVCIGAFAPKRGSLVPILQRIQDEFAYLSGEAMRKVAAHLGITPGEVYSVATFYNQFRFHPPGKHAIKVCLGTACHVRGGEVILENFQRKLGIREGQTTEDKEFSIDRVACVGCCALAPVALLGDKVYGHMAPSKVEGLILGIHLEKERQEREKAKHESNNS
ncbi:MAG: NADH-quinone oxidoreductase subunit NuoE [Deltaproteobacteria bacterium]|nr:NADH-quinone oxidoreductase subunit NuoE [Deltaproteobacteria bacterium]